jgi:hypothetical protein
LKQCSKGYIIFLKEISEGRYYGKNGKEQTCRAEIAKNAKDCLFYGKKREKQE